jgi:hypothetical protein
MIPRSQDPKAQVPEIKPAGPVRLHWAKRIAKIFSARGGSAFGEGENPVQCPRCHKEMKLKGFLLKTSLMFSGIQYLSRGLSNFFSVNSVFVLRQVAV